MIGRVPPWLATARLSRSGRAATALAMAGVWALFLGAPVTEPQPVPVAPGVTYERIVRPEGPWVIDVIRIDRRSAPVDLVPTLSQGAIQGNAPMPDQLPLATGRARPVAAVNGDFFVMSGTDTGTPLGLHMQRGELMHHGGGGPSFVMGAPGQVGIRAVGFAGSVVGADGSRCRISGVNSAPEDGAVALFSDDYGPRSRPTEGVSVVLEPVAAALRPGRPVRACVAAVIHGPAPLDQGRFVLNGAGDGEVWLSRVQPGESLEIGLECPGLPEWATGAVGGGPLLVRHGLIVGGDAVRHPRTAAGYNHREIILVTVDGRRAGWSVGMTLTELAHLMRELGCTDAMNLDGGGSTTMWVRGLVVNRPSDGRPRSVANGLAVVLNRPVGPPAHIRATPDEVWGLPSGEVLPELLVTDAEHNPLPVAADAIDVVTEGAAGLGPDGRTIRLGERPGEGRVRVSRGGAHTTVPVHVLAAPAAARIVPGTATAMPGDVLSFELELLDAEGHVLVAPRGVGHWSSGPGLSLEGESGRVVVVGDAVSGDVGCSSHGVSASAHVEVARRLVVADGQPGGRVAFRAVPADPDGPSGALRIGDGHLALDFDLGGLAVTRAAYAAVDRDVGRCVGFTVKARAEGCSPWVRVAYRDGNGTRQTATLADRLPDGGPWQALRLRLPDGTKAPVTLESVYVVETEPARTARGTLLLDDLCAWTLE